VLVIGGILIRRFRSRGPERLGLLEAVATVVGICAGVAGVVTLFAPDLAAQKQPAKSATMTRHDHFVKREETET
jgi:hypothetical protein